ncbi:hypothetical protein, partial [Mycobacterium tuberculosis]|uniref:hypothetical protein n=1 Tax=Mycobacterium tuberculosis TaxID=1773 RepID=UPI000ACC9040
AAGRGGAAGTVCTRGGSGAADPTSTTDAAATAVAAVATNSIAAVIERALGTVAAITAAVLVGGCKRLTALPTGSTATAGSTVAALA